MPSQPEALPEFLTEEEWAHLYRGSGPYRQMSRDTAWVLISDVFDEGLARTLTLAGQIHSTQRRTPGQAAPAREPDADELKVMREFFTLAIDMEPQHREQLRWVFAYSGFVPYFIDALRLFPAVSDAMEGDWQKASRFWMKGKYMSYAIQLIEGDMPRDYILAMYPIVPPTLRYPL